MDNRSLYKRALDNAAAFNRNLFDKRESKRIHFGDLSQIRAKKRRKLGECKYMEVDYVAGPRFFQAMNKPKLLEKNYRESQDSELILQKQT